MFRWDVEPEPHWREELYAIGGPPSTQIAYLEIVWWPGEPPAFEAEDQSVQRFVIVEAIPRAAFERNHRYAAQARERIKALDGPPPWTMRTWHVVGGKRVIRSRSLVSQWQWLLWRTTGCFCQPFWVIQGDRGGHLWTFPPAYQMLLRMAGRPLHPPAPGTLPYAPWDSRVRAQLIRERELREGLERFRTRDQTKKSDTDHKREDLALEREGRRQMLRWLDQQLGVAAEALGTHLAKQDLPVRPDREPTDEQLEAADDEILASTPTSEATL
jgi:hypothetical protein